MKHVYQWPLMADVAKLLPEVGKLISRTNFNMAALGANAEVSLMFKIGAAKFTFAEQLSPERLQEMEVMVDEEIRKHHLGVTLGAMSYKRWPGDAEKDQAGDSE